MAATPNPSQNQKSNQNNGNLIPGFELEMDSPYIKQSVDSFTATVTEAMEDIFNQTNRLTITEIEFSNLYQKYERDHPEYGVMFFSKMAEYLKTTQEPKIMNQLIIRRNERSTDIAQGQDQDQDSSKEGTRVIISNLDTIKNYCQSNSLANEPKEMYQVETKTTRKTHEESVLEKEYNLRLRMAQEIEETALPTWVDEEAVSKVFRYRKRYSYTVAPGLRFDLSVYKEGYGKTFSTAMSRPYRPKGQPMTKRTQPVQFLNGHESYDIELDYSPTGQVTENDLKKIIELFIAPLYRNCQIRQEAPIVLSTSEQKAAIELYKKIAGTTKFLGPNVYPMSLKNVLDPEKYPKYKPYSININQYAISFKADGVRNLLFVDDKQTAYLIDMNNKVRQIDIQLPTGIQNSLFDVELINLQSGTFSTKYKIYIFDTLKFNNKFIRDKPLIPIRYSAVQNFVDQIDISTGNFFYSVGEKKYYHTDADFKEFIEYYPYKTLTTYSPGNSLKNTEEAERHEENMKTVDFDRDGLIFTNKNADYPDVSIPVKDQSLEEKIKFLEFTFKVKNLDQLTIDFTYRYPKRGKTSKVVEMIHKEFQQFNVYVNTQTGLEEFAPINPILDGHDKAVVPYTSSQTEITDPPQDILLTTGDKFQIIDNFVYESYYDKITDNWVPTRLRPIKTVQNKPNAYATANSTWDLILNNVQNPPNTIGELTEDNVASLIFAYLKTSEQRSQITTKTIKTTKTTTKTKGTKAPKTPKAKTMSLQEFLYETLTEPKHYYSSTINVIWNMEKEDQPIIRPMNTMHKYIKGRLYDSAVTQVRKTGKVKLLELASGSGGDYVRWERAGITDVVGVELDRNQLHQAISRYKAEWAKYNSKRKRAFREKQNIRMLERTGELKRPINVKYLQGDITEDINSGAAGQFLKDKTQLKETFTAPNSFDIVACQFAIHFAMQNENSWKQFLNNVSQNLKSGGIFIGTSFIAERSPQETKNTKIGPGVYTSLQKTKSGLMQYKNRIPIKSTTETTEIIETPESTESTETSTTSTTSKSKSVEKLIWEIERKYPEKDPLKDYGQQIGVYLISLHNEQNIEYLVNLTSQKIIEIAENYNLKMIQFPVAPFLGNAGSPQAFGSFYQDMKDGKIKVPKTTMDALNNLINDKKLLQFSKLNSLFVFQKE